MFDSKYAVLIYYSSDTPVIKLFKSLEKASNYYSKEIYNEMKVMKKSYTENQIVLERRETYAKIAIEEMKGTEIQFIEFYILEI